MSLTIPQYFFDSVRSINELSAPFLKRHKLNYFQYCRVYNDGGVIPLSNRQDFLQARCQNKRRVLSSLNGEQIDQQHYVFLWNGNLPDEDTGMAREYDIDNGLCFVERFQSHYHLIAFGAASQEKGTLDFYLNKMNILKQFIQEFESKAQTFLKEAEQQRIFLPDEYQDVNRQRLFWKHDHGIPVIHNGIRCELSIREWQCLEACARGKTMQNIAQDLHLSIRTVETYLNRVKSKVGLEKKSELANLYYKLFD